MFNGIIVGVVKTFDFFARYLPSLRLIMRIIHRRDSHKWGVPAMVIAAPYFFVANIFKELIEGGGEPWLSIPMLWCLVMGIVFLAMGPASLIILARARIREVVARRKQDVNSSRSLRAHGTEQPAAQGIAKHGVSTASAASPAE